MDDCRKPAQSKKVAQHAEARFLAHWDEFVEHRKEVQQKFEEVFELAQDRREGEMRIMRICQQLETKIERCARHTKELHTKGGATDDRVNAHAKALDSCREVADSARDKIQRLTQELSTSVSSLRTEATAAEERGHQVALDALRRGDRCVADELLRKMCELNEKLGANMLGLEEEVAAETQHMRLQLEDIRKRGEATQVAAELASSKCGTDSEKRVSEATKQIEDKIIEFRQAESMAQTEVNSRTDELARKTAKLHDITARIGDRLGEVEQASSGKAEQLAEQIKELVETSVTTAARVRNELEQQIQEAVRTTNEQFCEDMRPLQDLPKELRNVREELRVGIDIGRDRGQRDHDAMRSGLAAVQEELHTVCREMVDMVQDVHRQVVDVSAETHRSVEALREELGTGLGGAREQMASAREEVRRGTLEAEGRLTSLSEVVASMRQRLAEFSAASCQAQAASEEARRNTQDSEKLRAAAESDVAAVRRDCTQASEKHEASMERRLRETEAELRRIFEALRVETQDHSGALQNNFQKELQREAKALANQIDHVGRTAKEAVDKLTAELNNLSMHQNEGLQCVEGQLEAFAREHQEGVAELHQEINKVAGAAQQLSSEVEQVCRRWFEEAIQMQEASASDAVREQKREHESIIANLAEMRAEAQASRAAVADQLADSTSRIEQFADGAHRHTSTRAEELRREIEEFSTKTEAQLALAASNARQSLQEHAQEARQQTNRQLDESVQTTASKVSEEGCKALKRVEMDLGQRCDLVQKACSELGAAQEEFLRRGALVAGEFTELRAEVRGELADRERAARLAIDEVRRNSQCRLDSAISEVTQRLVIKFDRGREVALDAARDAYTHCDTQAQELRQLVDAQGNDLRKQFAQLVGEAGT